MRPLPLYILSLLTTFALGGCHSSTGQSDSTQSKYLLVTTINPSASMIEDIADTLCKVKTLLPQGNSPESYEPSAQDLQDLAKAKAYMYMGDLGFERSWVKRFGELNPNLKLISLADHYPHHQDKEQHTHRHDPHYWTSIRGLRAMAQGIYSVLCQIDSLHQAQYQEGYQRVTQRIDSLEHEAHQLLDTLRYRSFVIYHPSLTDFAEEFNLRQLTIEQEGKEPTAIDLRRLVTEAKTLGTKVVFVQAEFDQRLAESIGQELGAHIVEIHPLGRDWSGELRRITHTLSGATTDK